MNLYIPFRSHCSVTPTPEPPYCHPKDNGSVTQGVSVGLNVAKVVGNFTPYGRRENLIPNLKAGGTRKPAAKEEAKYTTPLRMMEKRMQELKKSLPSNKR
jgi:hypothetical protein